MSLVPPTLAPFTAPAPSPTATLTPEQIAEPAPAPEDEPSAGSKFVIRCMIAALWSPFVVTGVALVVALTGELLKHFR